MLDKTFWLDRPVFVTGATGLIGGALVRQLLDLGADVVCLVRDWVPQSEFVATGMINRVKLVRGDLRDQDLLTRAIAEYEIQTVIHLAAQSIVGVANREPTNTLDVNIRGTWSLLEACRRSPLVTGVVLASTDKVYGDVDQLPYTEDMPYLAQYPHDVSKACAELVARTYVETYQLKMADHPAAQYLRGRRPELEPHHPGRDPLGTARPAAGDPLGWQVHPRLPVCRRCGRRPPGPGRGVSQAAGYQRPGLQYHQRDPLDDPRAGGRNPLPDGVRPGPRGQKPEQAGDPQPVPERRKSPALLGWAPAYSMAGGPGCNHRVVSQLPGQLEA
jgi:hypothetical protein